MRDEAAMVRSAYDEVFALVRSAHGQLREAEVQVERTAKRAADAARIAETALRKREEFRLELGRHLLSARKAWPERGPNAKGWGDFLAKEGIEQSTAWRYMEAAVKVDGSDGSFHADGRLHETPHPADMPDRPSGPQPSPRQPLGLLADMQLLVGRWEDVLSKDEVGVVDAIIVDPPYSERTHESEPTRNDGVDADGLRPNYPPWYQADVDAFIDSWSPRCRGWMVCLCDDEMIPWYRAAYERHERFAFQPLPCVIEGMTVRTRGDGPSSEAVYAMVARPRTAEFVAWGTLRGAHVGKRQPGSGGGRGKPSWLTDRLVRDYTRENDLVCDPLAGYGGTLVSAILQRRRAIGAEMDSAAVEEGFRRVQLINEPDSAQGAPDQPAAEQAAQPEG